MKSFLFVDWLLFIPIMGLSTISVFIIGSTTPDLLTQHITFVFIGLIIYMFVSRIDATYYSKFTWLFYIFSLIFLLASFFSSPVRGSYRWLEIGGLRLQPSELIKPFIIIILSSLFAKQQLWKSSPSFFFRLIIYLPVITIIFKQPDLGNVIVYLWTFIVMEVMNGLSFKRILLVIIGFMLTLPFLWLLLADYQKSRIITFLNPQTDPSGAGYNALQAMIAIGSGGLFGLGLGRGTQSHLLFLPEYHTDFVFASLAEELGFVGVFLVLIFYFIVLGRILATVGKNDDKFTDFLLLGIFAQLFSQVVINVGMNLGLLPITGITLPLLSYGRSSLLSTFFELGIVSSVALYPKKKESIVIR